mmetsp:Transcript_35901/g.44552  ORF Transcript_35901/g.44552 Transcript_35901/m.44552 type:complete len:422 (+) Transcript_35901:374-1639(+)|eukprot:CAMPEP_0204822496 /NCGR_PEP_ID=MMETSP1346-20131115/687_1 /ASSEMBLY_ACC=CAM_ASM_000771 /TAXON_ID=215587 /ORGANISM="Aplanochytrium stocchinoi, Strain GSBS06" /LENGTH=421 /DNA_ID=CAMNT_0051948727 /DNA_START=149 /DNA_END=1414 /DNA_ORIENTATION=-
MMLSENVHQNPTQQMHPIQGSSGFSSESPVKAEAQAQPGTGTRDQAVVWGSYEGERNDAGRPHGWGKVRFVDGSAYEGQFQNGQIEGHGKLRFPTVGTTTPKQNQDINSSTTLLTSERLWCGGEFKDGVLHGKGILVLAAGKEWYKGEFEKGKMHGRGSFHHANGDVTVGEFQDDCANGLAVRTFPDKSFYSGQFRGNKFSGLGTFTFSNGDIYEGHFDEKGACKFGVKQFASGTRYTGSFAKDKFDGEGTLEFNTGDVFEGQFKANMMHGYGVYKYKNGDWCQGDFVADKMTGKGEFYFANGNTYIGDFVEDEMHGIGVFTWKDSGEYYEGTFVNNKPGKQGKLTFSDGSSFKGSFYDGKPHGNGIYTYPARFGAGEVQISYNHGVREELETNKLLQQIAVLNSELYELKKKQASVSESG